MSTGTGYLIGSLGVTLAGMSVLLWMVLVAHKERVSRLRQRIERAEERWDHYERLSRSTRKENELLVKWRSICVSKHGGVDSDISIPLSTSQEEMRREVEASLRRDQHSQAARQSLMGLDNIEKGRS